MNSMTPEITREILTNLNDRLTRQNIIITTLCNIIVDTELISEEELIDKINGSLEEFDEMLKAHLNSQNNQEIDDLMVNQFTGPRGEA